MGVPGFRWFRKRYPLAVVDVIEEEEEEEEVGDDVESRINRSKPANPNKIEFDNLYLDLNDIIMPAFKLPAVSGGDPFQHMYNHIDRIFEMVRPRKLLYMVFDGVAPMAKTDKQRSRFFRSAKDESEADKEEERLRNEFEKEGKKLLPLENFKSTVAIVGSEFIVMTITVLEYYIHLRLNKDPRWRSIKVILSDAFVPGQAEHKIMSYIRLQRNLPGYDANTRHCLYGLDEDLIMLALASHEVHFSILREKGNCDEGVAEAKQPYQFLNIWTLREYLDYEIRIPNPPFEMDFERILDDFVFMCFFLGNDFLPQMPTLVTREGAVDLMTYVYRKEFASMGGYLTDSGKPILSRIEHFIQAVGSYEDRIFRKRTDLYQRQADRIRREKTQAKEGKDAEPQLKPESVMKQNEACQATEGSVIDIQSKQSETPNEKNKYMKAQKISKGSFGATIDAANDEDRISLIVKMIENEDELGEKLCNLLQHKRDPFNPVNLEANKVRLGVSGWKERYYKEKFSANASDEIETIRKDVVLRYTEGLCWLLRYYYEGVCSWQWFYPYHYAPFASDLRDLGQLNISFELGVAWKPLDQLMGWLPVSSSHELPEHYRKLMIEPDSPIIDFYPTDFEVDTEGKWHSYKAVVKIPFIDEGRLLAETRKVEHTLTEEEELRNIVTDDVIFVTRSHPLSSSIVYVHDQSIQLLEKEPSDIKERIDPKASDGMNGYLSPFCGNHCPPIFKSHISGVEDITSNQVIGATYRLPDVHKHITQPSADVIFPKKTVTEGDLKRPPVLWHDHDSRKKSWDRRQYFTNMSHHGSSRPRPSPFPREKEMQNPPTNSARPQLGEVARQFIVQNMQQVEKEDIGMSRMNQMHKPPSSAAGTSYASPHSNAEHHNQEVHPRPAPPGVGSHAYNSKLVHNTNNTFQNRSVHGYRDPYASSSSVTHCSPRYERNDWRATRRSDDPNLMSLDRHRPGLLHNAGSQYPPRNTENTPIASRADSYPRGGYNDYGRYSQAHRASDHHQRGGTPSPNDLRRGYGHPQQLGNQRHSDLDKNPSARPYQPPHMRDRY